MSLESGKKSAAEMRAAQRDMISKAEAVQPTVAVMEPNWKAMIESQKAQVDTLGKILEKLGTLTTEERFLAQLEMQLQVLRADGKASAEAMEQYRQTLTREAQNTTSTMEDILMERIRDKANAQRYDRMIAKREEQIAQAKKKIAEVENLGQTIRSRQAKLRKDISLIDQILADGQMTEAHLRLLIEKIFVYETEGGLHLDIKVKAPFQNHTDTYENGELTNSELEEIIKAG